MRNKTPFPTPVLSGSTSFLHPQLLDLLPCPRDTGRWRMRGCDQTVPFSCFFLLTLSPCFSMGPFYGIQSFRTNLLQQRLSTSCCSFRKHPPAITCSLLGVARKHLLHHGLLQGLHGNPCSCLGTWNTSSCSFFYHLGVSRAFSHTFPILSLSSLVDGFIFHWSWLERVVFSIGQPMTSSHRNHPYRPLLPIPCHITNANCSEQITRTWGEVASA